MAVSEFRFNAAVKSSTGWKRSATRSTARQSALKGRRPLRLHAPTPASVRTSGTKQIYFWKGDYEGYREVARTRNLGVVEVDYQTDPATLPPGHWFLSNPSARDGMIVPNERILAICEAGHKVFYDLSYLCATQPAVFDLSHPNIAVAAISFSKPFGLFYYRIGFTFSRDPIPTLYAWYRFCLTPYFEEYE